MQQDAQPVIKAPQKIKIVLSDLHLGAGRVLPSGGNNVFEEFYFGQKLVELLHYYSTGNYVEHEIELILNGDFLNLLQVDYRGHFLTVITESISVQKLKSIVAGHGEVFSALREFLSLPDRSLTYVVGNHDQAMLWPAARAYLSEVLGHTVRYKNLVYFFDGVHIEHGHMHEAANRIDPRKFFLKRNLPEPILNLPFGSHFFVDFVLPIKRRYPWINRIRPVKGMIVWALLNQTFYSVKSLVRLVHYFFSTVFVRDPRRQFSWRRILQMLLQSALFSDLSDAARKILQDDRVHTVIFGHTQLYHYRQWGEGKEYFNSGTWTEMTSLDLAAIGKITKLTYVVLEYPQDGGKPRGRLKEWRGYHRIEEDVGV